MGKRNKKAQGTTDRHRRNPVLYLCRETPAAPEKSEEMQKFENASKSFVADQSISLVLEFIVELSRQMIMNGANLERVHLAIEQLCHCYEIHEVSIYLLSTHIAIAGKDLQGNYCSRQVNVPDAGIHMARLKSLNRLSYQICRTKPPADQLTNMLDDTAAVNEYPRIVVYLAQTAAMACLCLLFGGNWSDVAAVSLVTFVMCWILALFARPGLNKIVTNALVMWVSTTLSILLIRAGLGQHPAIILITISMVVIPGIPLVNAVRNLLCANETNGILQLLKIVIESAALASGTYVSVQMFGGMIQW